MADATTLEDLDQRIAVIRDNIRELTEQAVAPRMSPAQAERIAEQEQLLSELLKEREALGG